MSENKVEKVKHDKSGEHKSAKAGLKRFRESTMATLSKLSKAFLLPIALLPIAGVFLGVGATIAANTTEGSFGYYIGKVMNTMGDVAFGNLPILFAISVAIAYTDDSGVSAITAVVGFLVMNGIQSALLKHETGGTYGLLWWTGVPSGLITSNVGISSLNTGVFASIFVGAIAAYMYNKFHKTQLPAFIGFFSGSKLVPIITFFAVIPLSFVFMFVWPAIGKGLEWFGTNSGKLPVGLDSLIYEVIERSLVPFGLHHVFYAPLWWSSAGGSILGTMEDWAKSSDNPAGWNYELSSGATLQQAYDFLSGDQLKDKSQLIGDQYMMYWILGANNSVSKLAGFADKTDPLLTFTDLEKMGLNLGRFQSGKFGFMLFALPAGAVAMWLNVPREHRKSVMGIYFSAAFTCFLTGITEPIEFTFLFLAPWLFYGVHMPLASISFMLAGFAKVHVSMTVSGGMIDYIVFGLIPWNLGTNAWRVILIAIGMAPLYFFAFYFSVKYANVQVPGRAGEVKLFTKADVKAKKSEKVVGANQEAAIEKARKIIEFLGGEGNIKSVDSCASRLRLTVNDASIVNKDGIMGLGGASGIIAKGTSVQVVYGGEQEVIKPHMKDILAKQRSVK
ncbi:PTS system, glucose-specific IIBC component [Spiroplasma helicoides]|uniref:PTS system, glucose-specific IIBC component n=1 Tax=Spiroplasma helicoides TaxID=216938 RepID=A0A1B3SLC8_9MOLU|nr:PTS transporter subunit EIIC [Spiroplasma helicoides]AOG60720.1 PTS system, glucose-specific IIBC component [Spiroplasma helicoides]